MYILMREDGAGFGSCSPEHAIEMAGHLFGLDIAYRYRPLKREHRGRRQFICTHCGMCGVLSAPETGVCGLHRSDGTECPPFEWRSTVAFVYGASAAKAYDPDADLDEIERMVELGAWAQPDNLVYDLIMRYRR